MYSMRLDVTILKKRNALLKNLSLPLPAVFVGVDVFHAPRRYDPKEKKRVAKESVAAVVVQVIRSAECNNKVEIYSETSKR